MTQINTELARRELLDANGISVEDLEKAFKRLDGQNIDYCDLYFQKVVSEGFVLEEKIIKGGSFNIDMGVGVRAISGSKSALAYSDEISIKEIDKALDTVKAVGQSSEKETRVKLSPQKENKSLYLADNPIEFTETEAKVRMLRYADEYARSLSPNVIQVNAHVASTYEWILIAGSDGRLVGDIRPLVRFGLSVIVEKDGMRQDGNAAGGGRFTLDYFTDERIRQYAKEAVESAVRNIEAQPSPAGAIPVVLGPGWPGVLLHEAVGHGLEGDFHRKGSSVFTEMMGKRIASPGVTVVDDGTIPLRRGSMNVDDEGNPTQRNVLIEDGILVGLLQDELNSKLMNCAATGNGRRESFAHLPLPRMTNTFLAAGNEDPKSIVEGVDYGIYAQNFGGGQVDITSGSFVFSMKDAWLIEKGRLTAPIRGAMLIGSGKDALMQIKAVGNDLSLDPGVGICGKDGQSVPVGVGMPTVLIEGLTVGGTQSP